MKILVTGSEGMLGRAVMNSLKKKEIQAVGVDTRNTENPIDITKHVSLVDFIVKTKPDAVIHTAAYTDVDGCESSQPNAYLVNSEGTKNVAESCHVVKCPMVYLSTDYVFDGKSKIPYTEEDEAWPINVYGKSKFEGENFIRNTLDNYLIARTSWLFGKGGKNFVDTIISLAESKKQLKVVDDQKGSPTYTVDLAEAIVGLLTKALHKDRDSFFVENSVLNITNAGSCSWYEFAKEILRLKDIQGVSIEPVASADINRPAKRPKMSVLDGRMFKKLHGRSLPTWQNALSRYLNQSPLPFRGEG